MNSMTSTNPSPGKNPEVLLETAERSLTAVGREVLVLLPESLSRAERLMIASDVEKEHARRYGPLMDQVQRELKGEKSYIKRLQAIQSRLDQLRYELLSPYLPESPPPE